VDKNKIVFKIKSWLYSLTGLTNRQKMMKKITGLPNNKKMLSTSGCAEELTKKSGISR